MFLDKLSYQALNLAELDKLIEPISALGRMHNKKSQPFLPGAEAKLIQQYQIIALIMQKLQSSYDFWETAQNYLLHLEPINTIIEKAAALKTLELYEIFEIKNFIYFSDLTKTLLQKNQLAEIQQIPDFTKLFDFLDKDGQKTPSFHLSTLYSKNYANLNQSLASWQKRYNYALNELIQQACQELETDKIEERIVVSRYNQKLNAKLQSSDFFRLEAENFANCSYKLRRSKQLLEISQELDSLENQLKLEEKKIRLEITKVISVYADDLFQAQTELANFDIALAKAVFGKTYDCIIPRIKTEQQLQIKGSRNLPIELELKKQALPYQPIDLCIKNKINVLTGANMGGKTSILKTWGQFVYLASHAIPLPCQKAEIALFDFIFFSGIQSDRMDLSSFGSEVVAVNEALKQAGSGFFLLDEFARGTNPQEGEAFSSAILKAFEQKEAVCFAATHFTQPAALQQAAHFRIKGIAASEVKSLRSKADLKSRLQELHRYMNYSLEEVEAGAEPPKSALLVASLLGVDEQIISDAQKMLEKRKEIK
ncbi:MAG: hypothetical protein R6U84_02910 [Candidatus Cloacimonadales bacterium]